MMSTNEVINGKDRRLPLLTASVEKLESRTTVAASVLNSVWKSPNSSIRYDNEIISSYFARVRAVTPLSWSRRDQGGMDHAWRAYSWCVIQNRKTGEGLRYSITDEWLPKILSWIKSESSARYDAAMSAEGLFQVEPAK
jgi:hypothetical protein